ncbi:hypothetical protein ILUMI_09692 [Ignelater luminosus]|uniref:Uncharacterized protein n=1 Tax=Ignelater luminosus TaxID=2038154 RepID=A0A8K0GEA6_IGNLU|nr:hypothetical protein ILUMI_09692 [Ignelater luminosus]
MKLTLLILMVLLQSLLVVSTETPIIEATTASTNASPLDIPAQVTEFLNANPEIAAATASAPISPDTKCECAVFNSKSPVETDNPILTQAPINVNCDATGEENCLKLCSALAQAAKERGPQLLCSHLGHYSQLTLEVYSEPLLSYSQRPLQQVQIIITQFAQAV